MGTEPAAAPYMLDLQILLTLVVSGSWWALYRPLLAQDHYRWWAWGWTAFLAFLVGARLGFTGVLDPRATLLIHVPAGLLQVSLFAMGAEVLRRGEDFGRRESGLWLGLAALAGVVVAASHFGHEDETLRITVRTLTRSPGLAVALAYCGWAFARCRGGSASAGVWVTAGGFFLYAADQAVYAVGGFDQALATMAGVAPALGGVDLVLSDAFIVADMAWEAGIGVGAILLLVEEKDRLFKASRASRRRFQALFEESVDGILVAAEHGRIEAVNPAASEMLGHDEGELVGSTLDGLIAEDDPSLPPAWDEIREREGLTLETGCRTAYGPTLPVELSLSAYEIDGVRYLQAIMRDISTRKQLIEQLTHRATHNPLTDLPNRQYVFDELARMLAMMNRDEARPAVLFLDLDRFKEVNDSYGHAAGDALLKAVADRLRRCVRDTELVGHFGGDEFVLAVPWCRTTEDLRKIGRRVRDGVAEPYVIDERELRVTASVGGALARPGDSPDSLVGQADEAMYRAKARSEGGEAPVIVGDRH